MKAIVQDRYGSTDVLRLNDIAKPVPGDGEVLVRVRAAGVDPGVWHLMTGLPYALRVMGYGVRVPKVRVRGRDVAGSVEAVGRNVTRFKPGDEVFGTCEGSFAEYVCAREDRLALKPVNLTFEQAAAVPISAVSALQGLRDAGQIQRGHKVLVIGAAGGVGAFAVQLAKMFGADVTGVCSTSKLELVRSLGADEVIDYTREDFVDGVRHFDLVLDTAGNRSLSHLRRALTPKGTLVIVGGEGGGRWFGGTDRVLRALLLAPFVSQRLRGLVSTERAEDFQLLREIIESGEVAPVIDRTYPLHEAGEAIQYVHKGHTCGKVVVTV
ncbi:NAD(P)-dependent alcohol dehydrogenase [Allokutzneria oryzae]|uniref:NAD(P)-dependent alcohol dehydrogenase n=1 Tax=Allokutzneria oryzae TaxID=1378989 RepID=A0ABV5ZXZ1_9PSEU